ncbi:MAG: CorA family divalent cation transporter [Parvibaculaceae bacterium]
MPVDAYALDDGVLHPIDWTQRLADARWIDVHQASEEERRSLEKALGVPMPAADTRAGSRLGRALRLTNVKPWMSAALIEAVTDGRPTLRPVAFALLGDRLVTFSHRAASGLRALLEGEAVAAVPSEPVRILMWLINAASDRCGDALDAVGADLERINRMTFDQDTTASRRLRLARSPRLRNRQLERVLRDLGTADEAIVRVSRSILTLRRLVDTLKDHPACTAAGHAVEALERKLKVLDEAENDLAASASFMLDSAVGFIGILQNQTMNTLTVIGVLLTPPVVVASIYGMNFDIMPELHWHLGYAWALGLMVVSGAVMYLVARYRGWL